MPTQPEIDLTRRKLLRMGLALPASLALVACGGPALGSVTRRATASAQRLELTPMCDEEPQGTPPMTAGPFFTLDSPQRRSLLEEGIAGTRLVGAGYVLSRQCEPVPGALLDFWQADDGGEYDNVGYFLRGHQYADEAGRYELETVVPGLYPGRTRHLHVKVQAPNGPILTTQLFFPNEPRTSRDAIFNSALLMAIQEADSGKLATFNFVVNSA